MFTVNEIDMMNEALDALKSKDGQTDFIGKMLMIGLSGPDADKDEMMAKFAEDDAEKEVAQKSLEERIILLKAKLIGLKDKAIVSELT